MPLPALQKGLFHPGSTVSATSICVQRDRFPKVVLQRRFLAFAGDFDGHATTLVQYEAI